MSIPIPEKMRFCKNCKHFENVKPSIFKSGGAPVCKHQSSYTFNLVNGQASNPLSCADCRNCSGLCGFKGAWFEAK